MNRRTHLLVLFLFLLTPSALHAQDAAADVRQLERRWLDAYERLDDKAMDLIVADDFSITFPDGSVQNKSQVMASLKPRAGATPSTSKFKTDEVQARVYGDTVILTGVVISEWFRDGKSAGKEAMRYTDTYVKREGKWQVVASHLSGNRKP
ncbi:MAG TPA: nuclear transport factor 2 family protein [Pyrinomonadaceae bacterium]|nr:nuclear transport factor 2 family protein [Pyrinomonadaceae bacterium]